MLHNESKHNILALVGKGNKNTITCMLKQIQVAYDFYFQNQLQIWVQRTINFAKFLRSKTERKENIDQEIKIQRT